MNWRILQRTPASEGVLAPHPALVLTRNVLAWAAALTGLFAILSEVIPLLYFHIHRPSLLPYHTHNVALWLVAAATILTLLMRMHPLKAVALALVGALGATTALVLCTGWLATESPQVILLTGTTTALVAFNARQMAELVLHRLHCSAWRGVLLLPSASMLLILSHSYELYLLDRLLIPFGVATLVTLVVIAPLLIDKRRVSLPPDRYAMLLWLPWCFSSTWFSIHWENYTAASGSSLISATVLYLAWRNSRPQPPPPAGPDPV